MKSRVAIVKCADYSPDRVRKAVGEALALLGGIGAFVSQGDSVFVKPNLLSTRDPELAVTTHPAVVEAVLQELMAAGVGIKVGDSPPLKGETVEAYKRLCSATGVTDVCERLEVPLVRLEESIAEVESPDARLYKKFQVSGEILNSSCWISVPKLKTHGLTTFTGAVKNIFGCIPGRRKGLFHAQACTDVEHFCEMLVDLLSALPPRLTVMDAVIGMEGAGPNAGSPRKVGAIVAGADPVAVDAVCCRLIGVEPMSIATTRIAHERGLGCGDISDIEVLGDRIEDLVVKGFVLPAGGDTWTRMPAWLKRLARKQLVPAPYILPASCRNCLDCLKACPVNAITEGARRPSIDLEPCIRCYCCHEVCTHQAIDLKKGFIGRLVNRG